MKIRTKMNMKLNNRLTQRCIRMGNIDLDENGAVETRYETISTNKEPNYVYDKTFIVDMIKDNATEFAKYIDLNGLEKLQ